MAALDIERESVKRDTLDLNRARRLARRRNDMEGVLRYTQMGKEAGLPVGRPVHDEEMQGVAEARLEQNSRRSGIAPSGSGLDAFDFRHSRDGGPGVGGFDFRQAGDRPSLQPRPRFGYQGTESPTAKPVPMPIEESKGHPGFYQESRGDIDSGFMQNSDRNVDPGFTQSAPTSRPSLAPGGTTRVGANRFRGNHLVGANGSTNSGSIGDGENSYSFEQTKISPLTTEGSAAYPSIHNVDQRAAFSRAWNAAPTQEAKDELVERAKRLGVPMNEDAARPSLERRGLRTGPSTPTPRVSLRDKYARALAVGEYMSPDNVARRASDDYAWEDEKGRMAFTQEGDAARSKIENTYEDRVKSEYVPETMDPTLNRPKEKRDRLRFPMTESARRYYTGTR